MWPSCLMVLSASNGRRKRPACGRPPWPRSALEAADDLSLALALLCAPRDVLLGATISAHPSQTDHVQRTVSVPVAYFRLRRCRTTLPVEASMGETPPRLAKEASLFNLS